MWRNRHIASYFPLSFPRIPVVQCSIKAHTYKAENKSIKDTRHACVQKIFLHGMSDLIMDTPKPHAINGTHAASYIESVGLCYIVAQPVREDITLL